MREQIDLLVKIQEKDQTLNQLRRQMQEGPQRIKESERALEGIEQDLEAYRRQIQESQTLQRQYEAEVEDAVERVRKSKARLLTIKNNKEYHAVLKEIEDTERKNAEKEDEILGCMEEIEGLKRTLQDKEKDLSAMKARFDKETKTIEAQMGQAQEQLFEDEKKRGEMAETVDPKILARYEQLRAGSRHLVVVLVENATCSGCHVSIPPQMYNELQRRDSLKFCPNCQRIIYWEDRNAVKENMSE